MNCRQITICDKWYKLKEPEDNEILSEHKLDHVYLRILDYQDVELTEI